MSGDAALYGDCAVAVSGTHLLTADPLVANGGTFTTVFGQGRRGHDTGTCLGGVGDFGYVLDRLETDGEEIATAHLRVAPSGTGPASGVTGSLSSTRRTRSCGSRLRRQEAVFGPGRGVAAGTVETRAGAEVTTHSVGATARDR